MAKEREDGRVEATEYPVHEYPMYQKYLEEAPWRDEETTEYQEEEENTPVSQIFYDILKD